MATRILALDLGVSTGWAMDDWDMVTSGAVSLASASGAHPGRRLLELATFIQRKQPQVIFFELVQCHRGQRTSDVLAGWRAVVELEACRMGVPVYGLTVQAVKRHATGNGAAEKSEMMTAAWRRLGWEPSAKGKAQEDEADARWVLDLGKAIWEQAHGEARAIEAEIAAMSPEKRRRAAKREMKRTQKTLDLRMLYSGQKSS